MKTNGDAWCESGFIWSLISSPSAGTGPFSVDLSFSGLCTYIISLSNGSRHSIFFCLDHYRLFPRVEFFCFISHYSQLRILLIFLLKSCAHHTIVWQFLSPVVSCWDSYKSRLAWIMTLLGVWFRKAIYRTRSILNHLVALNDLETIAPFARPFQSKLPGRRFRKRK